MHRSGQAESKARVLLACPLAVCHAEQYGRSEKTEWQSPKKNSLQLTRCSRQANNLQNFSSRIRNTSLRHLCLFGADVSDDDVAILCEAIKGVKRIQLCATASGLRGVVSSISLHSHPHSRHMARALKRRMASQAHSLGNQGRIEGKPGRQLLQRHILQLVLSNLP